MVADQFSEKSYFWNSAFSSMYGNINVNPAIRGAVVDPPGRVLLGSDFLALS